MFICQDRFFVQQFAQKRQSLTCDVSVQQNLLPFSLNHYSLEIGPSDRNYIKSSLPPQKTHVCFIQIEMKSLIFLKSLAC